MDIGKNEKRTFCTLPPQWVLNRLGGVWFSELLDDSEPELEWFATQLPFSS